MSLGMKQFAVQFKTTKLSEQYIVLIFRIEEKARQELGKSAFFDYPSTLKMEATASSKTKVDSN